MAGMIRARWVIVVFFLVAVVMGAATFGRRWLAAEQARDSRVSRLHASESTAHKTLERELNVFQDRLEHLEEDLELREQKGKILEDLRERLEEIRRQADRLEVQKGREERLLDLAAQVASQSVSTSAGSVEFLSILFTVVVLGLSLLSGLHLKELKEDIEKATSSAIRDVRIESDQAQRELALLQQEVVNLRKRGEEQMTEFAQGVQETKDQTQVELGRIRSTAKNLREQSEAGGAFLDGLVSIHAEAFSEILATLPLGKVLSEEEGKKVRLKGQELQGRLLLLHPDRERRKVAAMLLGAVGTIVAKVDLRRLQKDPSTDKELALLIESAIGKIDSRLGKDKEP